MDGLAKQVFRFGRDVVEGNGSMGKTLGGKGAGLAEMRNCHFLYPLDSRSRPMYATFSWNKGVSRHI